MSKKMIRKTYYCKLTLTHDVPQEGAILGGKDSYWVHICAMEYQQLVTTLP